MPVAAAKLAETAACTFSSTRGTVGSTVGRTWGMTSPRRRGSGTNAIVYPRRAPSRCMSRPKLCASGRYRSMTSVERKKLSISSIRPTMS